MNKIEDRYPLTIKNGIVRYWSVYLQVWAEQDPNCIPDRELAAMPETDRKKVFRARKISV
jgi:hypothetical protein